MNPDKDILLIEHNWELVIIIQSYKLYGTEGQLRTFSDLYQKISQNPNCPCHKNSIAYIDNVKDNLDKFLTKEEVEKIKKEEEVKLIHVKRKDKSILEI